MQTIEDRLRTVVFLLPPAAQPRFAAPLTAGESADSRLVEAVQALAKAEGLVCHTQAELARAKARFQPPVAQAPAPTDTPTSSAKRIIDCANPQQQTALWRSLTPKEKLEAMKGWLSVRLHHLILEALADFGVRFAVVSWKIGR